MKLAGIVLLVAGGLLILYVPLSMWWTYEQVANSTASPAPSDLADGISQSLFYGVLASPLILAGLVIFFLGIILDPKRARSGESEDR